MALKVSKVDVWAGNLRDVPGGLADTLGQFAAGGESIQFLIARRDDKHTGQGKVFITPVTTSKSKDAAARGGLQHATNVSTLRVEGSDKAGLGSKITKAIAGTGVNMRGVSAAVIGGRFVAYLGFDNDADANAAMAALKSAKINGAASPKRSTSRSKSAGRPAKRAAKRPAAKSRARR